MISNALPQRELVGVQWRKSSFSACQECVEVALLPGGRVAVRNSKHPERAVLQFPASALAVFIDSAVGGEFTFG